MPVWDDLKAKFGRKTIDKIGLDELRVEKIRLDQEEKKFLGRVDTLENEKKKLFDEGTKESSERRQLILARKIKEVDSQAGHFDRQLKNLAHQIRVVNGLIMLRESLSTTSVDKSRLWAKFPLEQLVGYVERATVEGEFQQERIKEVMGMVEEGQGVLASMEPGEEQDVQDIVKVMQAAREKGEAPEMGLRDVDKILGKKRESMEKE